MNRTARHAPAASHAPPSSASAAAADHADAFVAAQREHFRDVDEGHFEWQTRSAYIAATEAALLDGVGAGLGRGARLLEVGCGEGANLHHLAARLGPAGVRLHGVDFSRDKAAFAAARTGAATACADATRLPFADSAFDAVVVRDLLHHLPAAARASALSEARRVLVPGGRLHLLEPNGRNPLIAAAALVERAERGMLASNARRLEGEVARAGFVAVTVEERQPLPLSRLVLHHRVGAPGLSQRPPVTALLERFERAATVLPRALWAYVLVTAQRPPPAPAATATSPATAPTPPLDGAA